MSKIYGYARVSSKDQNADRQIVALQNFGTDIIFVDKQSGNHFDRPQYKKLLRKLKPNDVLVVKSIDRLGRNYAEILDQWRIITKDKKAAIVVLDTPLLDTRQHQDIIDNSPNKIKSPMFNEYICAKLINKCNKILDK